MVVFMGKVATRMCEGREVLQTTIGPSSVKSWMVVANRKLSEPFRCPERRICTNGYTCPFLDQLKI